MTASPDLLTELRHGAENIHAIGPVRAAALLQQAAEALAPKPQPARIAALTSALAELGDKACGLVVSHRGWTIDLLLPTEGDAGWVAFGQPDARDEHDDPLQVDAMGDTIQEALDACADACDEAENP